MPAARGHRRPAQPERERRPEPGREEQPLARVQVRERVDGGAVVRVHLEVEVVVALGVARVADVADLLAGGHLRAVLDRVGDAELAAALVLGRLGQVVVQVDVEVGRAALAVEVEHAAGARRGRPPLDLARLGRDRPASATARPRCRSPRGSPARGGRRSSSCTRSRRSAGRRSARRRRARASGAAPGDATTAAREEGGENEERDPSCCRPVASHGSGAPREGRDTTRAGGTELSRDGVAGRRVVRVTRVKIAVCVKQVPDATVHKRLDPATHRLDRSGEGALNATDVNAVEEALRLKEAHGGEVVVVSLGPEKAMDSLRKALAMGADRAVLVSDDAAAGSDLVATSRVLAKALEREEADLVLFGQQSSDGDGAVLWAAVADRLRRPMVSQVAELTVDGGALTGKRQTEFGYDVIAAPLPAVVAVSDAINEPRYPSLKGIMGAKSKPQEIALARRPRRRARATSARPARARPCVAVAPPPPKSDQVKIEDDGSRGGEDRRVPRREEADLMVDARLPRARTTASRRRAGSACSRRPRRSARDVAGVVLGTGVRDAAATAGAHGASQRLRRRRRRARRAAPAAARRRARGGRGARPAPRTCSSPPRCSPPTSPRASRRASRPASTGTSPTSALDGGELVGTRPALGDTVLVEVGWTTTPRIGLVRSGTFDPVESGGTAEVQRRSRRRSRTSRRRRGSSSTCRRSRAARRSRTPT